ncbi:MAG: orotidine-5'-phosphate decarboxylase [Acidimicrobiia bacterium]
MSPSFAGRLRAAIAERGPFCVGIDPSAELLADWGLGHDAEGIRRFGEVAVAAAAGVVAAVKPQSAYFERHGWRGMAALAEVCAGARAAGLMVVLDVKRGDIASTAAAYAQAYLGPEAPVPVDAITTLPYMGLAALSPMVETAQAGAGGVFVVVRSSNPEGRLVQTARTTAGPAVEAALVEAIGRCNAAAALPGEFGPVGAVFAALHDDPPGVDLAAMNGPFLVPGLGHQGGSAAQAAALFAGCTDRVLVSASRSVLGAGPEPVKLRDEMSRQAAEAAAAFGF